MKLNVLDKLKISKKQFILIIGSFAGFLVLLGFGSTGDEINTRIADAQINQEQVNELQETVNSQQEQIDAMITVLEHHETVLQQHDIQINKIANNTNTIAQWGVEFSQNINQRVIQLESNDND